MVFLLDTLSRKLNILNCSGEKSCSTIYHFDRSKALQLCSIGHHELTESSSKTSGSSCGEGKKHAFQSGGIFITIVNVVQIIPFGQSSDKSFICRNKE